MKTAKYHADREISLHRVHWYMYSTLNFDLVVKAGEKFTGLCRASEVYDWWGECAGLCGTGGGDAG